MEMEMNVLHSFDNISLLNRNVFCLLPHGYVQYCGPFALFIFNKIIVICSSLFRKILKSFARISCRPKNRLVFVHGVFSAFSFFLCYIFCCQRVAYYKHMYDIVGRLLVLVLIVCMCVCVRVLVCGDYCIVCIGICYFFILFLLPAGVFLFLR